MLPGNEPFYELSLKLWEGLEQDFNYNAMISQRGIINLFFTVMVKEMRMQEEEMQCCSKEQMLSFLMKIV